MYSTDAILLRSCCIFKIFMCVCYNILTLGLDSASKTQIFLAKFFLHIQDTLFGLILLLKLYLITELNFFIIKTHYNLDEESST